MAENTMPSWQACTGDEIAVIMRGKGKVALTDMRAAWATEGSLAGKLVDRALRLTDHGWVHEKLPHIAGLVAALLVGPGTDMFLNCGPGWGKTVLMRIATFGASGVCTVNMPLKALAQQVFDSLQSMAAAASKREGRVVARVYYVTCSMANGTTEPDAASFDELRRYAQAARRSTTPVTILVHGPEVTGTKGWKDMCLAVSGNGAFTICCEDEVHNKCSTFEENYRGAVMTTTATNTYRHQQVLARAGANTQEGARVVHPTLLFASASVRTVTCTRLMAEAWFRTDNQIITYGDLHLKRTRIKVMPVTKDAGRTAEKIAGALRNRHADAIAAGIAPGSAFVFQQEATAAVGWAARILECCKRATWDSPSVEPANELSVTCVHGQLDGTVKADTVRRMESSEVDVCCATSTFKEGLDVHSVNTVYEMYYCHIADVHQLMGRAGRQEGQHDPLGVIVHKPGVMQTWYTRALRQQEIARVELLEATKALNANVGPGSDATSTPQHTRARSRELTAMAVKALHDDSVDDIARTHRFIRDHVTCRWRQLNECYGADGSGRSNTICTSANQCDDCHTRGRSDRSEADFRSVELTPDLVAAVLIAFDAAGVSDHGDAQHRTLQRVVAATSAAIVVHNENKASDGTWPVMTTCSMSMHMCRPARVLNPGCPCVC